jgi:uroporphyrinogen III methyltransferase/synthase
VFARGGEEAAALQAAGVPYEIVPGITSAIAAPAYAGIPVTLRHSSTSFTVVTGHEDPSVGEGTVDWKAVAQVGGTIVVLMGMARIEKITGSLIDGGRSPETPAAAVQWGTRPTQRTVRSTLGELPAAVAAAGVGSPATIVVGEVAAVDLAWFESKPLFGLDVIVTRPADQARELVTALTRQGAGTVELPAIEITDPADGGAALRGAVTGLGAYDWVVLTSPNGARRLLAELPDARALGGVQVAAIGPGTAAALLEGNIRADLVPERFVAESLLEALPAPPAGGEGSGRILLARAAVALDVLPDGLRAAGWQVDVVEAYRTVPATPDPVTLDVAHTADVVSFTSSSTVTSFLELTGGWVPPAVACIGPVTAATAREAGLTVHVEAEVHTVEGLVDALVRWRGEGREPA